MTACEFWLGTLSNVIAGVIAAIIFALIVYGWRQYRQRIVKSLFDVMGRAIQHRNDGRHKKYADQAKWVEQAEALKREAVETAKKWSPAAGALVEWLDEVDPYDPTDEVAKWVSFLSKVIERLRGLVERHS